MKLGVLGGTFDPVHRGHLAVAREARESLGLDKVLMVPAGRPGSVKKAQLTGAQHRLAMLRLAVVGEPHLEVSTIETDRPGPSYTVDTMAALREKYGDQSEIYFILGDDSLAQLPAWHEPRRLIKLCRLVAVPRPGHPRPDLEALEARLPGIKERVTLLTGPHLDISATAIRARVARGESIADLVPEPVAVYIKMQELYQDYQEE
jgi:nicotinate-nucleotide adenylyltransferase